MRVYILILFFTLSLFGFLFYRSGHPLSSYQKLTKLNSFYIPQNNSPCKFHIIGGIPNSPLPDGNVRVNFNCPDGSQSNNYLRLGAVNSPVLSEILNTVSQINNFSLSENFRINVNGEPSTVSRTIKINDTIDVYLN